MKQRLGVMLCFMHLPFLRRLDDPKCGKIFLQIVEQAEYEVISEINDLLLGTGWDVVHPRSCGHVPLS